MINIFIIVLLVINYISNVTWFRDLSRYWPLIYLVFYEIWMKNNKRDFTLLYITFSKYYNIKIHPLFPLIKLYFFNSIHVQRTSRFTINLSRSYTNSIANRTQVIKSIFVYRISKFQSNLSFPSDVPNFQNSISKIIQDSKLSVVSK